MINVLKELAVLKRNKKKSTVQIRRMQEQKLRMMLTYRQQK